MPPPQAAAVAAPASAGALVHIDEVREELREHGFAVCRQLLCPAAVDRARQRLQRAVDQHVLSAMAEGAVADGCGSLPLETGLAHAYAGCPDRAPRSWEKEVRHAFAFRQLLFRDEALVALVRALTGGREAVVAERFNCRSKLPYAEGAAFPWHQDHAFFRMQYLLRKQPAKRLLAVWAPLVPVDARNGAVEVASGSHLLGYLRHKGAGGFLAAGVAQAELEARPRQVPRLEPGDVLLFTDLTLHRSGLNFSDEVRWSADWAFELQDADDICPALTVANADVEAVPHGPSPVPSEPNAPAAPAATPPAPVASFRRGAKSGHNRRLVLGMASVLVLLAWPRLLQVFNGGVSLAARLAYNLLRPRLAQPGMLR